MRPVTLGLHVDRGWSLGMGPRLQFTAQNDKMYLSTLWPLYHRTLERALNTL